METEDPEYRLFLDHLRPLGATSYALEMTTGAEPIYVEYEGIGDVRSHTAFNNKKKKVKEESLSLRLKEALESDEIDGGHRTFLESLKKRDDGSIILDLGNRVVVELDGWKEEEEEEETEEGEGTPTETATEVEKEEEEEEDEEISTKTTKEEEKRTPYMRQKTDFYSTQHCDAHGRAANASFKSRLVEILKRPFDEIEYDELQEWATLRKPVTKVKILRGTNKDYETNRPGSSYFDYYPDFADKFKHADRFKGLELLRGFFFWLENLDHEGSFKPWHACAKLS